MPTASIAVKRRLLTEIIKSTACHERNLKPILTYYIYHKINKGKPPKNDLPLLKNDITGSEYIVKILDT
jgi:hypothetical protein